MSVPTLVVGENCYADVAYADAYFALSLYTDAWDAATPDQKAKALLMATKSIDRGKYVGTKAELDQPLEFPRRMYSDIYSVYKREPLVGLGYMYPNGYSEGEIQPTVKEANCLEAIAILRNAGASNTRAELQRQGVTSFTIGKLSEAFNGRGVGVKLLSREAELCLAGYSLGGAPIV